MKAHSIKKRLIGFRRDESGAVTVVVVLVLVVLLGIGALAIDVGHMCWVQNDLKKAAEAGALAGARGLWPVVLTPPPLTTPTPDPTQATNWALNTTTSNNVDGVNLSEGEVIVQVGQYDYATQQFNAGISPANGVRVTTQRNDVPMFLAQILGVFSKDMSATATAVMDSIVGIGGGSMPIAVNKYYSPPGTEVTIILGPSPNDQGGWFTKDEAASDKAIGAYIDGGCPALSIGDLINLNNGFTSNLKDLSSKLAANGGELYTFVPVVETDSFNHANIPITDFVPFKITEIMDTGAAADRYIKGTVVTTGECAAGLPGKSPPGGSSALPLSPPKLVQCKN
jgi:Flp pilus assembly protein TadG